MIRSATQVTAEVLDAGDDLVVVGRAGIGLDNVDVAEATRRGVMVVNAPQSNILSAAEHTLALLLAQARNVPQANADLKAGTWNRSKWEGVELHGKTLGIVGLGRVGVLVAQRAHAFGMRLVAYDPFVSADRARQLGVALVPTVEELVAICDFVSIHATKTPETVGLVNATVLAQAKPGMRLINAGRGGIVDEDGAGRGDRRRAARRRRDRHVRHRADDRVAAVRARQRRRDAASRRVDGRSAGQGGRDDRRAGGARVARRLRAVRGQRRRVRGGGERATVSCRSPNGSGGCSPDSPAARRRR